MENKFLIVIKANSQRDMNHFCGWMREKKNETYSLQEENLFQVEEGFKISKLAQEYNNSKFLSDYKIEAGLVNENKEFLKFQN